MVIKPLFAQYMIYTIRLKGYSKVPALQHHAMKACGRTEGIAVVIQHETQMCVHL